MPHCYDFHPALFESIIESCCGSVEIGPQDVHITQGLRVASFFRLRSMIRDAYARNLIFDLDTAIQSLVARLGRDDPETVKLSGIYHSLIRYRAEV